MPLYSVIISKPAANCQESQVQEFGHPTGLLRLGLPAELTSLQARKSQTRFTQIVADAGNAPCYAYIPGIFVKKVCICVSSFSEMEQTCSLKPLFPV
jgi:hypothetical protein